MRITRSSTMFVAAALALAACGGASTPAETTAAAHPGHGAAKTPAQSTRADHSGLKTTHEHGSQPGHGHDFPPDVTAFHDVLSPVWHSQETPKPACASASELYIAAEYIDPMSAPEGVNPDAWQEAVDLLLASALELSQACTQMGDEAAAQRVLVEMHDRFHALVALLGHDEEGGAR